MSPHKDVPSLRKLVLNTDGKGLTKAEFNAFVLDQDCDELLLEQGWNPVPGSAGCTGSDLPRPALGIALSGGGPRSASYSLGVLKAFQEAGYLDHANHISSVSGGSYANYWLLMQRYYQLQYSPRSISVPGEQSMPSWNYGELAEQLKGDRNADLSGFCQQVGNTEFRQTLDRQLFATRLDTPLNESVVFQAHVADQSDIINWSESTWMQYLETTGLATSHFLSLPPYWITDVALRTNMFNGSVFTNAYRKGLERTYGFSPNRNFAEYYDYYEHEPAQFHNSANGTFLRWRQNSKAQPLKFKDVREFMVVYNSCAARLRSAGMEVPNLPLPMFNATAKADRAAVPSSSHYKDADIPEKAIYSFTPIEYGSALEGHNQDASLFVPINVSKAVAVSGAAVDRNARQTNWLLDSLAGLTNFNLGFNIRNPRTQENRAGTIWYIGSKLINGFPLGMLIPKQYKPTIRLSDGGGSENLGAFSLVRRGVQRIVIVDAEQDANYEFDGLRRLQSNLQLNYGFRMECFDPASGKSRLCPTSSDFVDEKAKPYFLMRVVPPWSTDAEPEVLGEILYLKLSIEIDRLVAPSQPACKQRLQRAEDASVAPYLPTIQRFACKDRDGRNGQFPHNTTADIWYQTDQVEAYRDLGFEAAREAIATLEESGYWSIDRIRHDNALRQMWSTVQSK